MTIRCWHCLEPLYEGRAWSKLVHKVTGQERAMHDDCIDAGLLVVKLLGDKAWPAPARVEGS